MYTDAWRRLLLVMMHDITQELVYTTTADGLDHAGILISPTQPSLAQIPIVWVHGAGASFSFRPYVLLASSLAHLGYPILLGNNRGHDFGYFLGFDHDQPRYAGQGWEFFDQAPNDIDAWITFLENQGYTHVILAGHSLGATKVIYYQAHRQDSRVSGVVSASAPADLAQHSAYEPLHTQAAQMVRDQHGHDLLPWGSVPGGGTLSAQTYYNRATSGLDVYGLDTPTPLISQVHCPVLALYGTQEAIVGGADDLVRARAAASPRTRVETVLIEDADHVYTGHETVVAHIIDQWVRAIRANTDL
jgi:pimeloyl-ACP methyl ester carboxylesterase